MIPASYAGTLLLMTLMGLCNQDSMSVQQTKEVLRFRLEAKDSYLVDQAVTVGFYISNISTDSLWVLTWYTPLEGINGKIFLLTRNGKEIPYEGRMVKRGSSSSKDYVRIAPGDSAATHVDLALAYDLGTPGEYQLEFKGKVYDVVADRTSVPQKPEDHQGMELSGNSVMFKIVAP